MTKSRVTQIIGRPCDAVTRDDYWQIGPRVIHSKQYIIIVFHAMLRFEHEDPIKQSWAVHFVIASKDDLFWPGIVTYKREVLILWRHIHLLFLHMQTGTKLIVFI